MGTGDGAADETGDGAADGTEGCGVGLGEGGRVGVGVGGSEGSVEGFIVGAKVGSPVGGGLWYRKSEGGAGRENAVRGAQERCAINIELPMTRTIQAPGAFRRVEIRSEHERHRSVTTSALLR
eukprot:CAMPEP_0171885958 /NCGR_PEP_ID=MMETSP0992-20121227/41621_1 /TAXON_ID=483369 /ORGANISM="non described non described, Strain CCMP2098" /LENGTH=122 /DNA_ID=CAMNT_0012512537 /DNA_START=271 /DNA_END=634 /DNA_ORIENTATION=+